MATTKNLCAQIPIDLHERVSEERERLGQTTSEYIANLIQDYYNMMENQKGGIQMTEKGRTMAFQIPEELFQRIKRHLERETLRTGKKFTQRDFVLNLITQALDEADAEKTLLLVLFGVARTQKYITEKKVHELQTKLNELGRIIGGLQKHFINNR